MAIAQRHFAFFLNKNINNLILYEMEEKRQFFRRYVEKQNISIFISLKINILKIKIILK